MTDSIRLPIFEVQPAPATERLRWFVRQGAQLQLDRGFASKEQAHAWISGFGSRLDWRVGFLFRLRGDEVDTEIVDRTGVRARL